MSNGRVERLFSSLELIKTNRRTLLSEDHSEDAVRIAVDGPPFEQWEADDAVQLWWSDKRRRQIGDTQKHPEKPQEDSASVDTEIESSYKLDLQDWEDFLN